MTASGLRARVERLLNGDVRGDDLSRLLLFTRDHCDGRRTVKEIGDFIAHHTDRNKGLVTDEARDWFLTTSFVMPRLQGDRILDLAKLPPNIAKVLAASYRRLDARILRDHAGLRYADAYKMLPEIFKKLAANRDGTLSVTHAHTASELRLIETLLSYIVSRPAFDAEKLFSEFEASLRSNGLVKKEERDRFATVRPALALLAVAEMHNCTLELEDGSNCKLSANISDGTLAVYAPVLIPGTTVFVSQAIFTTSLQAANYCSEPLLERPEPWTMDLEPLFPRIMIGPLG